jgi:tetratricopeptide (TPR) repeat protein
MRKLIMFGFLLLFLLSGCQPDWKEGGDIHLRGSRYDRAIEQYEKGAIKNPNSYVPLVSLATAYYMKKEYMEAVNYLEKATEMDREGTEGQLRSYEEKVNTKSLKWQIYYNGAVEYFKDEPEKGINLAKKALEVEDSEKVSQSYNLLASMMFKSGKIEEAVKSLTKAIELNTKNIEAYMTLGHHYLTQRKTQKALENFNKVLKIDSTEIKVYELIGQAHLVEKAYAEAIKSLEKALSILGKNPTILYNLMVAHYEAKDYDKAISYGKEVLELEGAEPNILTNVYNLMGQIYQKKGDHKNAVAVIKEAIDKGVNNCDSYSIIAFSSYKLNKMKESEVWSKKYEECVKK